MSKFINKTEYAKPYLKDTDIVEIWISDIVGNGCMLDSQKLRKYKDGSWKLTIYVHTTKINIPLQEWQALQIINQEFGVTIDTMIVSHNVWDGTEQDEPKDK